MEAVEQPTKLVDLKDYGSEQQTLPYISAKLSARKTSTLTHSLTSGWKSASAVRSMNSVSSAFTTLRDMHPDVYLEFDKMKFVRELGAGGFGSVKQYELNGVPFAIKVLHPTSLLFAQDVKDFGIECALLKKLRHRNIVEFRGMGDFVDIETGHQSYFCAQECMTGGSLAHKIYKTRDYTPAQALRWAQDVARALRYLHAATPMVIHRDLKPDNILLSSDGTGKLCDFGYCKLKDNRLSEGPTVYHMTGEAGSYRYMAPEVFLHQQYDERVDIFSWAIVFYELLMYRKAHEDVLMVPEQLAEDTARKGLRPALPKQWPQSVKDVLATAWDANPKNRPTAAELLAKLKAIEAAGDINNMQADSQRRAHIESSTGCKCVVM